MKAVIVANGKFNSEDFDRLVLMDSSYILACDGGLQHCHNLGITPNYIVGDMDSVNKDLLLEYKNVPLLRFHSEKDQTDLELAIAHACDLGIESVIVLGGLGGRFDHQLGNIHALAQAVDRGVRAEMWDELTRVILTNNYCRLHKGSGILVTLIPLTTSVDGIITDGLKYPLRNESLFIGSARGVSNEILGDWASVSIKNGHLLVVQIKTSSKT